MFKKGYLGNLEVKNRIIRSATYEGMFDYDGVPGDEIINFYKSLSYYNIGVIITGFIAVSKSGRAMQPRQGILDSGEKIEFFKKIAEAVKQNNTRIIMQIAHTGRQTVKDMTGEDVLGVSGKKTIYFRNKPRIMTENEIHKIIDEFVQTAFYAKEAGFDGIQIHAAHGYLIHQFILESINNRKDEFVIDREKKIGTKFLNLVIDRIRQVCGMDYCILVKISGSDDYYNKFSIDQFKSLIKFLDFKRVDGIEISYGTMDYPMNIFRGMINTKAILKHNYFFKKRDIKNVIKSLYLYFLILSKTKKFSNMYNIDYAKEAKSLTDIPIISVGGFRSGEDIQNAIDNNWCDFVSLSRPFICEKDFANKIYNNIKYRSKCINCNLCVVMCDTGNPLKCYMGKC